MEVKQNEKYNDIYKVGNDKNKTGIGLGAHNKDKIDLMNSIDEKSTVQSGIFWKWTRNEESISSLEVNILTGRVGPVSGNTG